jgi:hypothetical protein
MPFMAGKIGGIVKRYWLYAVVLVFLLSACEGQRKSDLEVDEAAKALFAALQARDIDKAMSFYADDFFKAYSREAWRERLQSLYETLGDVSAVSFRNKQADTRYSGKFYIYQYDTVHGEKRAKHIVTFIRPVDKPGFYLMAHQIRAKGLQ